VKRKIFLSLFIFSLIFSQNPENAFIIIIDGLRNDEAFESESLYIPHIWNDLKPLGTIYTRFWNKGWTATTAGHNTIACGVRQIVRNTGGVPQDIRPEKPTFFEYYRQFLNLPETACGAIMGKGNCRCVDFSLEPYYGENFKGFLIYNGDDTTIANWVHKIMDSLHPRLVFINLREVDAKGHSGDYSAYLSAIKIADSIIYEFYKHIQGIPPYTDTFYRNKTIMIVTTDHGRNDDAHLGFSGHGEWDHGCRHLLFLALGPEIRQNIIIDSIERDQIDIIPTLGYLLGFPTYFSEGEIMTEMIEPNFQPRLNLKSNYYSFNYLNLSSNSGFSRDPEIIVDKEGRIHLIWLDNTRGKWEVYYRKSYDGGLTWTPIRIIFDFPGRDTVIWYSRISADDSLIVSGMGYAKVAQRIDSLSPSRIDSTFIWYPWVATSIDGGENWQVVSFLDSNMGSCASPVSVKNNRYAIAYWQIGKFSWERTQKGLYFNWRPFQQNWQEEPKRIINRNFQSFDLLDDSNYFHIIGSCLQPGDEDYEIGYWQSENGDSWRTQWITRDTPPEIFYDFDPSLVKDDTDFLHLVWARKPNENGNWQIYYSKSIDNGYSWTPIIQITQSPSSAWKPKLIAKRDSLYVLFVDYRDNNSEIYLIRSTNRGLSWLPEERITYNNSFSTNPKGVIWNDKLLVVWQDFQAGNWDIFLERINTSVSIQKEDNFYYKISTPFLSDNFFLNLALPYQAKVQIDLYDVKGAYLKTILKKELNKGNHQLTFKKERIFKGIYFLILRMDKKLLKEKIILFN